MSMTNATMASFKCSYILARRGKPFTDGEMVKKCMIEAAKEVCPDTDKVGKFQDISFTANTVARRVDAMGDNVRSQVKGEF